MTTVPLLEVKELEKHFDQGNSIFDSVLRRQKDIVHAVDGVSFTVREEDSLAVIGESGCGKTTLLFTLAGLHEPTGGEIYYKGEKTSNFTTDEWKEFRKNIQVIFQDPFNTLNPKMTVRESLQEPLDIHGLDNKEKRIRSILSDVQLNPVDKYIDRFPEKLSGGEKQRVAIARALILEPNIILADEPVSMLDVSTQAAILTLLEKLAIEMGVSVIYISHDLSTVSYIAEQVKVMYLGRMVESAPTSELLSSPKHPYTRELISAVPIADPDYDRERTTMSGAPRDPINIGEGCRFRDRCPDEMEICDITPKYKEIDENHHTACHLHYDHNKEAGLQEVKYNE